MAYRMSMDDDGFYPGGGPGYGASGGFPGGHPNSYGHNVGYAHGGSAFISVPVSSRQPHPLPAFHMGSPPKPPSKKAYLPTTIMTAMHPHVLELTDAHKHNGDAPWRCNVCGTSRVGGEYYKCHRTCDYSMCDSCRRAGVPRSPMKAHMKTPSPPPTPGTPGSDYEGEELVESGDDVSTGSAAEGEVSPRTPEPELRSGDDAEVTEDEEDDDVLVSARASWAAARSVPRSPLNNVEKFDKHAVDYIERYPTDDISQRLNHEKLRLILTNLKNHALPQCLSNPSTKHVMATRATIAEAKATFKTMSSTEEKAVAEDRERLDAELKKARQEDDAFHAALQTKMNEIQQTKLKDEIRLREVRAKIEALEKEARELALTIGASKVELSECQERLEQQDAEATQRNKVLSERERDVARRRDLWQLVSESAQPYFDYLRDVVPSLDHGEEDK